MAIAQVTSDGTVNTQVTTDDNVAEITGGETRGDNLFHSFQDFSVPTNNEAFFNNANDIANIFSRVTGGNISNIDGLIRANGSANLFLVNPNGILFGENASLDIGGSFYGSTADSILFEEGEYSATDLDSPPLLTINAPIGLNLRNNPAEIINRSVVQNNAEETVGLEVSLGNNLTLVGGEINFEGGNLTARGGRIELGGLSQTGTVAFNSPKGYRSAYDGSLSFPEDVARADVNLSNGAVIDVRGTGGGDVAINARNLKLEAGELGDSIIVAGISPDSIAPQAQAGDITINATDNVTVDRSSIANQVDPEAVGNGGDVTITTNTMSLTNGGQVGAGTRGQGNGGNVEITANDNIVIDGENSQENSSGAFSQVTPRAVGDGGDVTITTDTLSVTNGGQVSAGTRGQGNAGSVEITANDNIVIDGENSQENSSGAFSQVTPRAVGDGGDVTITTDTLSVTNGGQVSAGTAGQGNAGSVEINATDGIAIDGENSQGIPSLVASQVNQGAEGDGGDITITTDTLSVTNGGAVSASTFGQGNAGSVEITANDNIVIDDEDSQENPTGAFSQVIGAEGDGGNVTITTDTLSVTNGGQVSASTAGQGNAGSVEITANDNIVIDGENSQGNSSAVASQVASEAVGSGGDVTINTNTLSVTNGAGVSASTFGQGNAGSIEITATDSIAIDGKSLQRNSSDVGSQVERGAEGDAGDVTITTDTLSVTNGGEVGTSTFGQGNAGSIEITATDSITIDGENTQGNSISVASLVAPGAEGDGGDITITTNTLSVTNGGAVNASTFGRGNAGSVEITATDSIAIDGESLQGNPIPVGSQVERGAVGFGGDVTITTDTLSVTNGGQVGAGTIGQGNAGSVEITATDNIAIDGENSRGNPSGIFSPVAPEAEGDGGNVTITTDTLSVTNGGAVNTNTEGQGNAGEVTIEAGSIILNGDNARISSSTNSGNGGIVNLSVASTITLKNDSSISAEAFEEADGGNLSIDAQFIVAFPDGNNDLVAAAQQGQGGNININAESVLGIQERPLSATTNDINASSSVSGLDGTVDITTTDIDPIGGATELPSNLVVPQQTTEQACQSNRELAAKNGLTIEGKGGVPPAPELPLNSLNTTIEGEYTDSISATPQPIKTSKGEIQPARGIKKTKNGIILTAYPTNNQGDRLPEIKPNCGI